MLYHSPLCPHLLKSTMDILPSLHNFPEILVYFFHFRQCCKASQTKQSNLFKRGWKYHETCDKRTRGKWLFNNRKPFCQRTFLTDIFQQTSDKIPPVLQDHFLAIFRPVSAGFMVLDPLPMLFNPMLHRATPGRFPSRIYSMWLDASENSHNTTNPWWS